MITSLIKENKIYNQKVGNKAIIDLDEVLQVLGLLYEWFGIKKIEKKMM